MPFTKASLLRNFTTSFFAALFFTGQLLMPHNAWAVESDSIKTQSGNYASSVDSMVAYLEDSTDTLSIEQILKSNVKDDFQLNLRNSPFNLGYNQSAHWFAFQLENSGKKPLDLVVEVNNAMLDSVQLFVCLKDKLLDTKISGRQVARTQWNLKFRNPAFALSIPPGKYRELYLRVKGSQLIRVPLRVFSRESFDSYKDKTNLVFSLFYAFLFIVILHNLFLFISSRDFTYFFYLLCIAWLTVILINENGFPFQYAEFRHLRLNDFTVPYLIIAYSFLLFSIGYLRAQKLSKALFYILIAAAVLYPLIIVTLHHLNYSLVKTQGPTLVVLLALTFGSAIFALQNNYRPAWYYLCAIWVMLLGASFYLLELKGRFSNSFWLEYTLQAGLVIGATFFSLGLSERQKLLEKEGRINRINDNYLNAVIHFFTGTDNKQPENKPKQESMDKDF